MSKQFEVRAPGVAAQTFTARQYLDAKYAALPYVNAVGFDGAADAGLVCLLHGAECTPAEFIEACDDRHAAWFDNFSKTHKKVRVLHGSSAGNYVTKWVRI